MITELLNYCDQCEEEFSQDKNSERERYYESDICYKCAEEQWERWNDRQSEYWA